MRRRATVLTMKQTVLVSNFLMENAEEHRNLNARQILERIKQEFDHEISIATVRRLLQDFNLPFTPKRRRTLTVSQDSFFVLANQLRVLMDDIGEKPLPEFKRMFETLVERRAEKG